MLQKYIKECNSNYPQIPDHPYRLLIIGGSESGKMNSLVSLISHQEYINKIYLYAKDPNKARYQFVINKRRKYRLKVFKWIKRFYWILKWYGWYENIEEYNPNKKQKILIVLDDMIADMFLSCSLILLYRKILD